MQLKQNTIQILDARGQIIATMALPANIKLAELAPLKILGDISSHAFAQLGTLEITDWNTKVYQWCECMENELDDASAEAQKAPPLPHYLLDQRSNDVAEAISAERAHATRWWTHLSEMRRRRELPEWVAADIGTHDEHDLLLESRKAVNQALFGSDDLGGNQPYRLIPLDQA